MREAEFGYYTSDSQNDVEPNPYDEDYVPDFEFDTAESCVAFFNDGF